MSYVFDHTTWNPSYSAKREHKCSYTSAQYARRYIPHYCIMFMLYMDRVGVCVCFYVICSRSTIVSVHSIIIQRNDGVRCSVHDFPMLCIWIRIHHRRGWAAEIVSCCSWHFEWKIKQLLKCDKWWELFANETSVQC